MKKCIAVYLLCSVINYGLILGLFTHKFPYQMHYDIAVAVAFAGPLGTPAAIVHSLPHFRFRLRHLSVEERWVHFHKTFPSLDREEFERSYN